MFYWLLCLLERCFPLIPTLTEEEVGEGWVDDVIYYGLDDADLRIRRRWRAVLTLDRDVVSFYRKRTALLPARQAYWEAVAAEAHAEAQAYLG